MFIFSEMAPFSEKKGLVALAHRSKYVAEPLKSYASTQYIITNGSEAHCAADP